MKNACNIFDAAETTHPQRFMTEIRLAHRSSHRLMQSRMAFYGFVPLEIISHMLYVRAKAK